MVRFTSKAQCTKNPQTREKTVNQYRLLEEVGRGSFSKVKWAEDDQGKRFAVKVFSKGVLERRFVSFFDEDGASTVPLRERIDEELRILGTLSHRNVCSLEEVINDPEHENLYAVLEGLIGGQILVWDSDCNAYSINPEPAAMGQHWGDTVSGGRSGADEDIPEVAVYQETVASHLFRHIVEATAYLHERGVIHKDIKPDNVMLTLPMPPADPRFARLLSLADWPTVPVPRAAGALPVGAAECGSAAAADCGLRALLAKRSVAAKVGDFNSAVSPAQPDCLIHDAEGTQLFTPPECFADHGDGIQGKPRDVWSLGCVLFTMLFGRCPYWAEDNLTLQFMIRDDDLTVPTGVISPAAEELIRKLMARDPTQRLSAAQALQHSWFQDSGD